MVDARNAAIDNIDVDSYSQEIDRGFGSTGILLGRLIFIFPCKVRLLTSYGAKVGCKSRPYKRSPCLHHKSLRDPFEWATGSVEGIER